MAAREIVRVLTIKNRTEGAQETARELNEVKRAADGVVQASERTERATLSNSRAFDRLQRSVDPAYRSHRQFQSAIQTLSRAVEQNNTSLSEANRLAAMAATRYGIAADEVRDLASAQMMLDRGYIASNRSLSSANDNIQLTRSQLQGIAYQTNDIATMLLMGASPFQIMASQGGQVAQILGDGPGGVRGSLQALGSQLGSLAARFAPVGIAVAALGSGVAALRSEINETSDATVSFGDVALGVWQMIADGLSSAFRGPIEAVQGWFSSAWEWIGEVAVKEFNNIARNVAQLGAEIGFAVDVIQAHWEGSVKAIKIAWELLPGALGDIVYSTANRIIDGIEGMAQSAIDGLNNLMNKYALWRANIGRPLDPAEFNGMIIGPVEFGGLDNQWEGQAAGFMDAMRQNVSDTFDAQVEAFRRLQDRKAEIAAWNPFEDLTNRATANALSDVEEAAKGAGSAIGSAANDNIDPWKGLRGAVATVNEGMEFARDVAGGFVSDLRNGLKNGEGFWRSFADAASNALDKIIDKLLNEVLDAVFQVNRSAGGMGGGGGFLGSLLGGLGNMLPGSQWSIAAGGGIGLYDSGGWTGAGNPSSVAGLVHREEFVVKAGPAARYRPMLEAMNNNQPVAASGGVGDYQDNRVYNIDARGAQRGVGEEIKAAIAAYDKTRRKRYQGGAQFG